MIIPSIIECYSTFFALFNFIFNLHLIIYSNLTHMCFMKYTIPSINIYPQ